MKPITYLSGNRSPLTQIPYRTLSWQNLFWTLRRHWTKTLHLRGGNLAFKLFFSINFFYGKLVPYIQQNLADPYFCDKGKRQCHSKKKSPHNPDSIMAYRLD